jgi:hypothetical protein
MFEIVICYLQFEQDNTTTYDLLKRRARLLPSFLYIHSTKIPRDKSSRMHDLTCI